MKENKLIIVIHKPIDEVFGFTINPKNTPLWIDSIKEEKALKFPPKVGTTYMNRGNRKAWSIYRVKEYQKNKSFALVDLKNNYTVRYRYTALNKDQTELEYHEWVNEGELEAPFDQETLLKLKSVMEN